MYIYVYIYIIYIIYIYNICMYVCIYMYINISRYKSIHSLIIVLSALSATKFTRPIPGNVCVQDEALMKPMYSLVIIQHHVERIL